jgi:hypothetical protein
VGRILVPSSKLIGVVTWPLRAASHAGVGTLTGQGDGRGDKPRRGAPSGSELTGLGFAIAASFALPFGAGLGADALLHSSPVGVVIGLFAGIIAVTAFVVSQFRRYL